VVGSPTRYVHIALRPITIGSGTLEDAVAYSQQLKAYPLEAAGGPPANRYIDAYPLAWKTLPSFDVRFLELLAEMIDQEPPQAKDAAMIGMLASIGIEPGTPFQPQGERAELLAKAVQDGAAAMNDYFINQALWRTGRTGTGWPPSPRTTTASPSTAMASSTTTIGPGVQLLGDLGTQAAG
jgi:hypothetical protein